MICSRRSVPDLLHFHNTRGTGLANVLTALDLGVTEFDASVGGIGGCPYAPGASGNMATEEVVHMLDDMGIDTGIDLDALIEVAEMAEKLLGQNSPIRRSSGRAAYQIGVISQPFGAIIFPICPRDPGCVSSLPIPSGRYRPSFRRRCDTGQSRRRGADR